METHLTIKHLAGYLPYGLKIKTTHGWATMVTLNEWSVNGDCEESYCYETEDTTDFKPILRPLSDLTKAIEVNGEKFVPHIKLGGRPNLKDYDIEYLSKHIDNMSFGLIQKLLEWHFDIYGLIENNLAIDINTL